MIPEYIILHCSDSPFGCARIIDVWHRERGFDRVGYQYIILNGYTKSSKEYIRTLDGAIEVGRYEDETGAHARGYNSQSIGICLIGTDEFTPSQMESLGRLVADIQQRHNIGREHLLGHYETALAGGKTCPNLDMKNLRGEL